MEYFEWEVNNSFHREDHYFAQLTAEVVRGRCDSKSIKKVKESDYVLEFKRKDEEKPISREEKLHRSKRFWLGGLGIRFDK